MRLTSFLVAGLIGLSVAACDLASAQQSKKPFTVADDIELALFGDSRQAVRFSPDGNYVAAYSQRGRLDLNRVEDSLRFYRSQDVEDFLKHSDESQPPSPVWIMNRSSEEGPIINNWRWLADSSGVAFLQSAAGGNRRLVFADLRKKTVEPLTLPMEMVKDFDIRDRRHYVYTADDSAGREKWQAQREAEHQAPAVVGTGRSLWQLLFPDDSEFASLENHTYFWAVIDGKRLEIKNNGVPIVPNGSLVLSPDGTSLVTKMGVADVPPSWATLFPPSFPSAPYRIRAGTAVHQYVKINLRTGGVQALTDAPISNDAGAWAWVYASPSWSVDGQTILLPGTFVKSKDNTGSRPCAVAAINSTLDTISCIEILRGRTEVGVEEGYHEIKDAHFVGNDKQRVIVVLVNRLDSSLETAEYWCAANGIWQVVGHTKGEPVIKNNDGLEIVVKQDLNEPPLLVASYRQTSRVIWDPNPQVKKLELGEASGYGWKDKEGREWKGGLYKPVDYKPGQRYPLVIQTHGFTEVDFVPSGYYATGFAARALAAAGIMVLQVGEHCPAFTPLEGSCAVSGYESAATQLISEGLVDPERIGIIGFSRTCFYVMETLTTASLRIKAASITDGVMLDYFQYMLFDAAIEFDPMIGAKPFGEGLQQWLKRSPGFNLDKITAPLLVVGEGPASLLGMWEPYAALRYLHKPVDLIMLNTDEHVLTNPAVRMASQGGSVDWFRFWLQDYENPDPAKAEQYARWRELSKLQEADKNKLTIPRSRSN